MAKRLNHVNVIKKFLKTTKYSIYSVKKIIKKIVSSIERYV